MRSTLFCLFATFFILSGCTSYPIKSEVNLVEPVEFKFQQFRNPNLTKEEVVTGVKVALNRSKYRNL